MRTKVACLLNSKKLVGKGVKYNPPRSLVDEDDVFEDDTLILLKKELKSEPAVRLVDISSGSEDDQLLTPSRRIIRSVTCNGGTPGKKNDAMSLQNNNCEKRKRAGLKDKGKVAVVEEQRSPDPKKNKVDVKGKKELVLKVEDQKVRPKRKLVDDASSVQLKTWQFYVHPMEHFTSRVSKHTNCDIIRELREKLDDHVFERFKSSCFGHFLEMPEVSVQNQLIHALLLREVVPRSDNEMWFKIYNTNLRFGLKEFGLVTGLKCRGDELKDYDSHEPNRLMTLYFDGASKVKKNKLSECFKQRRWNSDDDALKISVLYFIHTFLFSTKNDINNDTMIKKEDFNIVESGDWEYFPWGKTVFGAMLESMHDKLRNDSKMFRYGGLPLALQVWFYECCPYAHEHIANRVANTTPRILNWKVSKHLKLDNLQSGFFKVPADLLALNNIQATTLERSMLELPEGPDFDAENVFVDAPDFISYPKERSTNIPGEETQSTVDFDAEFKSLKAAQIELKKDIAGVRDIMNSLFERVFRELADLANKFQVQGVPEVDVRYRENSSHDYYYPSGHNLGVDNESGGQENHQECVAQKKEKGFFGRASCQQKKYDTTAESKETVAADLVRNDDTVRTNALAHGTEQSNEVVDGIPYEDLVIEQGRGVVFQYVHVPESQIVPYTNPNQEATPAHLLREKRPAKFNRSPYLNNFGSTDEKKMPIFSMQHPLVSKIGAPVEYSTLCKFVDWVDSGYKKRTTKEIYLKSVNELKKKFDFGVYIVDKKDWFYTLNYADKPISDTHLDVILYYLRKKGRFDSEVRLSFTTTDSFFDSTLRALYNEYRDNSSNELIKDSHVIAKYIRGSYMRCNTPWHMVDSVLFPIRGVEDWHWILARLDLKDGTIYVYDSKKGSLLYNAEVIQCVESYSVLIPLFLSAVGFYGTSGDKSLAPRFDIVIQKEMPPVDSKDYGVYVAAFAEYFIQDQSIPDGEYDIGEIRQRYCILLWDYGTKKQQEHAESDTE